MNAERKIWKEAMKLFSEFLFEWTKENASIPGRKLNIVFHRDIRKQEEAMFVIIVGSPCDEGYTRKFTGDGPIQYNPFKILTSEDIFGPLVDVAESDLFEPNWVVVDDFQCYPEEGEIIASKFQEIKSLVKKRLLGDICAKNIEPETKRMM